MTVTDRHIPTRGYLAAVEDELTDTLGSAPSRWVLVSVDDQAVTLVEQGRPAATWRCSTALAGVDNREHSGGTPPGVHRIADKIGQDATVGTVFVSREPTGEVWDPATPDERDLVLTRILTLEGLEDGLNRGPGIDTLARYVYLHGTNHERDLGHARSHGCVRLSNADIVALFDRVEVGDPVVIA